MAKLNWLDCPRLFLIEVRKSLLQRLPLELDLLKDRLLEVHLLYLLVKHALIHLLVALVDYFNVLFVLRVALGVMSEVEALGFLNLPAHPLAEIRVVDLSVLLVVLIDDELGQVFEVEVLVLAAEEAEDVIHRYIAVIIGVKVEKGFSHTDPVVCKLVFDELFQLEETISDRFMVFSRRWLVCLLGWLVRGLMIRAVTFVLLDLEVLREESAPEIFKIHLRSFPVLLRRQLLLSGRGRDLEHVLPRNELLDILQCH